MAKSARCYKGDLFYDVVESKRRHWFGVTTSYVNVYIFSPDQATSVIVSPFFMHFTILIPTEHVRSELKGRVHAGFTLSLKNVNIYKSYLLSQATVFKLE